MGTTTSHELAPELLLVPVAVLAVLAMLWRLSRVGALAVPRVLVGATACAYGVGIVANTVLPIRLGDPGPRPSWTVFLNLVPLAGTEPLDMVRNVLVFAPLGVLLPLVARVRSAGRVLLLGFLLSLAMELLQLANAVTGHGGHVADVNDLLANTIGATLGLGVLRVALLVPGVATSVRAATWPRAQAAAVRDPSGCT